MTSSYKVNEATSSKQVSGCADVTFFLSPSLFLLHNENKRADQRGGEQKPDAIPTNATAKLSAACIRFGNVAAASAAASVPIAMITNAAPFIQRSDKRAAQICFPCRARPTAWRKPL